MTKSEIASVAIIAATIFFFWFVAGAAFVESRSTYNTDLIERGLALYCPHDGRFAFPGECDD